MMKIFFILLLLFVYNNSYGQEQKTDLRIFTNVFQNIDVSHPNVNIGIERGYRNKQYFSLRFGVYYKNWIFNDIPSGLNYSLEYKKFKTEKIYYALGLKGGHLKYNTTNHFLVEELDSTYMDSYNLKKMVGDLYANIGFRQNFGSNFYFDYFAGLGLRYKDTEHKNRIRPEDDFNIETIRVLDIRDREGKFLLPVLKLGIVIGLKI